MNFYNTIGFSCFYKVRKKSHMTRLHLYRQRFYKFYNSKSYNKRNDKRFNNRGYSLLFLKDIFLSFLLMSPLNVLFLKEVTKKVHGNQQVKS